MKQKRKLELQSKIKAPDGTALFARLIQQPSVVGNVPIVLNDGLGCDGFIWKHFIDHFQHQHPIIHWHYRGHGHSDTPNDLSTISISHLAKDIELILDHFKFPKVILAGHSMGVQVALQAYENNPKRFASLILLCGSFEYPLKSWHASQTKQNKPTFLNRAMKAAFPIAYRITRKNRGFIQPLWSILFNTDLPYQTAMWFEVNRHLILKEDLSPYFDHLSTMQAHVFMQMMKSYAEHSAKNVLPQIQIPSLIITGGKDTFSPHWVSKDMHHSIPNSELLFVPEGTHCTPIEHPELIHLRVEKFLCPILTQSSNNSCNTTTSTSMPEPALKRRKRTASN